MATQALAVEITKEAAQSGMCRYCNCTAKHGCARECFWADEAQTVCTIPNCIAKAAEDGVILKAKGSGLLRRWYLRFKR
jgi:hypothetical protein